jgi:cytochrome c556
MFKKLCVVFAALLVLSVFVSNYAQPREDEKKPSVWMKKKLDYSQEILAGLANEDFKAIATSARAMNDLNQFEKFFRARTPEYREQLQIFDTANKALVRQAEKENLDGATIAFMQLTTSCVNCHKIVRNPMP